MKTASVCVLAGWISVTPLMAAVVTNTAVRDNTIYSEAARSNGQGVNIFAGLTDVSSNRHALVAFTVTNIPAGSTINSATVRLYMNRTTTTAPRTFTFHRLTQDWGEGTSNANGQEGKGDPATTGDATWIYRFYNTTSTWTSAGGTYIASASASTSVALTNAYYTWTGLAADVQAWLNGTASNFGWILKGDTSANHTAMRFASREESTVALRPILIINYTPPATIGACLLTNGNCIITNSAGCTALGGSYQGNGSVCPPPPVTGACCYSNGTCVVTNSANCTGTYQGDGTVCGTCPVVLAPFVDALPIPAVATPVTNQTYILPIRQVQQQLHRDLPATTVYGYNGTFPGPTIVATRDIPTTVIWSNALPAGNHYLPVDSCVHGAETPSARIVAHLHGGHVPPEADGYPTETLLPGEGTTYVYPNNQLPATLWYHDHALGITRLNVIMGLAGFYLLFDAFEQSLGLPAGEYEIGLAIQDRTFNANGSFAYPALWEEMFFGDTMLVNGKVWPYLNVKKGKYRFRLLNGCTTRTLTLGLSNAANFQQLGTEGGLLPAPVTTNSITLGAGERADVVFDFAGYSTGTQLILKNSDAMAGTVTNVMKFIVGASTGHTGAIPGALRPLASLSESNSVQSRNFILRKMPGPCGGQMWAINDLMFDDVTEFPVLDSIEVWNFVNPSGVMHPMHMHLVMFQVLDRQACTVSGTNVTLSGPRLPPSATEAGWKDTVRCPPGMVTRVIAKFDDYLGLYPYHCHILEHEENEMMRQFEVLPPPQITGLALTDLNVHLQFTPTTNRLHRIERRTNLVTGSWTTIASNLPGHTATVSFTDTNGAAGPAQFYRVILQP